MLEQFLNNESIKKALGGASPNAALIPGANINGTTASLGSVAGSIVNVLFVFVFIVSVYIIIKASINKIRSEGTPKGNEVFAKVIRNTFAAALTMVIAYILINVVWFVFTGVSLFAAPNALRECGGVTVFDYQKSHDTADTFYSCVNGQFVQN